MLISLIDNGQQNPINSWCIFFLWLVLQLRYISSSQGCPRDCFNSILTWSYLLHSQSKKHTAKPALHGVFKFKILIKSCIACLLLLSLSIKDNVSIVCTSVLIFVLHVLFCKSKITITVCYAIDIWSHILNTGTLFVASYISLSTQSCSGDVSMSDILKNTQQQCRRKLVILPNSVSMYVLSLIHNGQQNLFNSWCILFSMIGFTIQIYILFSGMSTGTDLTPCWHDPSSYRVKLKNMQQSQHCKGYLNINFYLNHLLHVCFWYHCRLRIMWAFPVLLCWCLYCRYFL
jgi:hypothetical protein